MVSLVIRDIEKIFPTEVIFLAFLAIFTATEAPRIFYSLVVILPVGTQILSRRIDFLSIFINPTSTLN